MPGDGVHGTVGTDLSGAGTAMTHGTPGAGDLTGIVRITTGHHGHTTQDQDGVASTAITAEDISLRDTSARQLCAQAYPLAEDMALSPMLHVRYTPREALSLTALTVVHSRLLAEARSTHAPCLPALSLLAREEGIIPPSVHETARSRVLPQTTAAVRDTAHTAAIQEVWTLTAVLPLHAQARSDAAHTVRHAPTPTQALHAQEATALRARQIQQARRELLLTAHALLLHRAAVLIQAAAAGAEARSQAAEAAAHSRAAEAAARLAVAAAVAAVAASVAVAVAADADRENQNVLLNITFTI